MNIKYFIFFIVLLFTLLALRFYTYYLFLPRLSDSQKIVVNARIVTEPEIKDRLQRFKIKPKGLDIYVTTGNYPIYSYAEFLNLKGKVKVTENDDRKFYTLPFPEIKTIDSKFDLLTSFSLGIRIKAIKIFGYYLSDIQSALLLGIVFGIKQNMPDDFMIILRDAGVVHVIAASGMNVSMVAGSFIYIFQRFFKRRTALFLSLLILLLYVSIAGFEASIVRAAIMAGISFTAGITGRQKYSVYALFLTAVFMLFINPSWIFDVGFKLSFMATLGIITLKPVFDQRMKVLNGSIKDDFNTTLAAQLATIPILLYSFGSINLLSILINLLILWTIPALMVIGGLSIISGLIFAQLGSFISVFSIPLLIYFEVVVRYFDRFKIPLVMEESSWILWVGYYLLLAVFLFFIKKKGELQAKKVK